MALYYLRPTNGLNTNDGLSYANAWQTLQYAFDNMVAGDTLRMVSEATETTAVQIDVDTAGGSATAPIILEPGDTIDGSRDMTLNYTVQATASMTAVIHWSNRGNIRVHKLIVDGNSQGVIGLHNDIDGANGNVFNNCRFTNCSDGVRWRGQGGLPPTRFVECEFDNNTGDGITYHTASRGNYDVVHSKAHNNGAHGMQWGLGAQQPSLCAYNECYRNGADGINFISNVLNMTVFGNTCFDNTGDGLQLGSNATFQIAAWNNTFVDNGGYGINWSSADVDGVGRIFDYNHTHNNALGATSRAGGMPGDNNQTGDPLFTNTTIGSEDFTPLSGSPLLNNGLTA